MSSITEAKITKEQFIQEIVATKVCHIDVATRYANVLEQIFQSFMIADNTSAILSINEILYDNFYDLVRDHDTLFTAAYLIGLHAKSTNTQKTLNIKRLNIQYNFLESFSQFRDLQSFRHLAVLDPMYKLLSDYTTVTVKEFDIMHDHFIENNPLFAFLDDE